MSVHDTFSGARRLQKTLTETIKPLTEKVNPLTETAYRNEQPFAVTNKLLPGTPEVPGRMKSHVTFMEIHRDFQKTAWDFDENRRTSHEIPSNFHANAMEMLMDFRNFDGS